MIKNYKKILQIIVFLLLLLGINNALAYDEEYHYNYSNLGDLGRNSGDFYLGDLTSEQDFRVHIVYESYDCEQYNDFALVFNGVSQSIPCTGDGNRTYVTEFGTFENLVGNSVYEMYLIKYRDDRRGIGQLDLYVEYLDGGDGEPTPGEDSGNSESFFWGSKFDLFSDVDDLHDFLKWQAGVMLFFMLSILMLKLFIYKP